MLERSKNIFSEKSKNEITENPKETVNPFKIASGSAIRKLTEKKNDTIMKKFMFLQGTSKLLNSSKIDKNYAEAESLCRKFTA